MIEKRGYVRGRREERGGGGREGAGLTRNIEQHYNDDEVVVAKGKVEGVGEGETPLLGGLHHWQGSKQHHELTLWVT